MAQGATVYPSPGSVVVPHLTLGLQTTYSRNPESPGYNQMVTRVPTQAPDTASGRVEGKWLEMIPEDIARVLNGGKQNWPDNTDRPETPGIRHRMNSYKTERDSRGREYGDITLEQALTEGNDLARNYTDAFARQAQLAKLLRLESLSTDLSTVGFADAVDTTDIGGALQDATDANPYVRRMVDFGVNQILTQTAGNVDINRIGMFMNKTTAQRIAASAEVQSKVTSQPEGTTILHGAGQRISQVGLPTKLYNQHVTVVHDRVVETPEGAASTSVREVFGGLPAQSANPVNSVVGFFVMPDRFMRNVDAEGNVIPEDKILDNFESTPVVGSEAGTFAEIFHEDMTAEVLPDITRRHRRTGIYVVNNYDLVILGIPMLFLVTDVFGAN